MFYAEWKSGYLHVAILISIVVSTIYLSDLIYYFITLEVCVLIFMTSPLLLAVDPRSLYGELFTMSFWLHGCCGQWEARTR